MRIRPLQGPSQGIRNFKRTQAKAECIQVRLWSQLRQVLGALGNSARNQGKPEANCGNQWPCQSKDYERGLEIHWNEDST